MREITLAIIRFPIKIYILTWTYFLIWRGKKIPKWLQEETLEKLHEELELPRIENYRR